MITSIVFQNYTLISKGSQLPACLLRMKCYDRVSRTLLCTAADHPRDLTAEQLPRGPGSFRVSWTPPASLANLTGYHIYYSGAGDSGNMDVGASATEVTIDNCTAGVTYTITLVALSPHLPSPMVGPVTVTLGEANRQCCMCWTNITIHLVYSLTVVIIEIGWWPNLWNPPKDGEFESHKWYRIVWSNLVQEIQLGLCGWIQLSASIH